MPDYIDRSSAISKLRILADKMDISGQVALEQAMSVLESMDEEDVVPVRRGKWGKAERDEEHYKSYSEGYAQCSVCSSRIWLGWWKKHCEECGAKMENALPEGQPLPHLARKQPGYGNVDPDYWKDKDT